VAKQRDTMFRHLFKIPSHFIPLLEKCRGENVNLTENQITLFDLDTDYAIRPRRNDISFLVDGKIVILVEHQSTINPNMALRLFLYYNELLQLWIKQNNINLYGNKKIESLPLPEFYVVYDGREKLKNNYSTLRICHNNIVIDVSVKIINIHYNSLEDTSLGNPLAGYAYFQKVYDENIKLGLSMQESFELARQTCIKNGYLTGHIEKEEFIMFYKDFLNYDNQVKAEVWEEALAEGKAEGVFEIISNMLKRNKSVDDIADFTGLTREYIMEAQQKAAAQS